MAFEPNSECFSLIEMSNELIDIVGRKADKNRVEFVVDIDAEVCAQGWGRMD